MTALYGGTFDPPHLGHRSVVESLSRVYDQVIVMPSCSPPHKRLSELSAPPEHRLAMVKLMVDRLEGVEVSDLELSQNKVCYTAETLRRLGFPPFSIALAMGADMFYTLESWYHAEYIFRTAEIAVLCRAQGQRSQVELTAQRFSGRWGARVRLLEHVPVEVSSTLLRERLADIKPGLTVTGLSEDVAVYIYTHRLYGSEEHGVEG